MKIDVIINVPRNFDQRVWTVIDFHSWKTSQLFIARDTWSALDERDTEKLVSVSDSVRVIVE